MTKFWKVPNGLPITCQFRRHIKCLFYDSFILEMNNVTVKKKLYTEPKGIPDLAKKLAKASNKEQNEKLKMK